MKTSQTVLPRLVGSLGDWDEAELRDLANLLDDDGAVRQLRLFLKELIALRAKERAIRMRGTVEQPTTKPVATQYEAIRRMLGDRSVFPTTASAVRTVSRALGIRLRVEDYKKDGRSKLFRKVSQELQQRGGEAEAKAVERLLNETGPSSSDGYRELFKRLVHK